MFVDWHALGDILRITDYELELYGHIYVSSLGCIHITKEMTKCYISTLHYTQKSLTRSTETETIHGVPELRCNISQV